MHVPKHSCQPINEHAVMLVNYLHQQYMDIRQQFAIYDEFDELTLTRTMSRPHCVSLWALSLLNSRRRASVSCCQIKKKQGSQEQIKLHPDEGMNKDKHVSQHWWLDNTRLCCDHTASR